MHDLKLVIVITFEQQPKPAAEENKCGLTYILDRMTADSAASATALMCGVKTNYLVIGMDGQAVYKNCIQSERKSEKLDSVLKWAQASGKRTGIVTTARITHATPAAAYANTPSRDWEGDSQMSKSDFPCKDIARQLIEDNKDINVLLGGGRRSFIPNYILDPETSRFDRNQRQDGRNLTAEWLNDKEERGVSHDYVWNRDQFLEVDGNKTDFLLGLFDPSHMNYDIERMEHGPFSEPSLSEMVGKAIDILKSGTDGFFLLVEGAKIDHGHHLNKPESALYDVLAMDKAVNVAISKTDFQDTLMIVTADHSHAFNIASYPSGGSDILAKGAKQFPSGIPLISATHSAEDVSVYAKGPMTHLVHGVQEQTYFVYVMAYAACIGPYATGKNNKNCLRGHGQQNSVSDALCKKRMMSPAVGEDWNIRHSAEPRYRLNSGGGDRAAAATFVAAADADGCNADEHNNEDYDDEVVYDGGDNVVFNNDIMDS
ncbi:alkaline phosphatase-like [Mercenaria mercenaria]|uniref:alkaline phosphatase-like n=1 Tax=Mercenaria mercenaria TaxID=6596 RepID=UPI00234F0627|nr:alkaline phosphatase-like [Mercenaria mercenaria]